MTNQDQTEPFKVGTLVKILHSGFHRARIAEDRGLLGPKGARVYRVLVQSKPRRMYIEVLGEQLEVIDETKEASQTGS